MSIENNSPIGNDDALKLNYESRVETLNQLYKRFMQRLDQLDPYDAVVFSTPMCDCLLIAMSEIDNVILRRDADKLINGVLKNPEP
jgi:hypothetical protein